LLAIMPTYSVSFYSGMAPANCSPFTSMFWFAPTWNF
jgi:hypothetical protein